MALFSSVLHLRDIERDRLVPAVDAVLRDAGFVREYLGTVPAGGPHTLPEHDGPCYVASALSGRWITLIETSLGMPNAPHLAQLCTRLSSTLSCYALSLVVHDDDLFFYNLDYKGHALDGYNSFPQYFEEKRMTEADIDGQRHTPEPFAALLPSNRTLEELRSLLDRGWWHAHDNGRLDQDGVPVEDDDGFLFEGDRMTAFGTLLQLHGTSGPYPYAGWANDDGIHWPSFLAIRYRRA